MTDHETTDTGVYTGEFIWQIFFLHSNLWQTGNIKHWVDTEADMFLLALSAALGRAYALVPVCSSCCNSLSRTARFCQSQPYYDISQAGGCWMINAKMFGNFFLHVQTPVYT